MKDQDLQMKDEQSRICFTAYVMTLMMIKSVVH